MHINGTADLLIFTTEASISPVTLSADWSKVARLLLLTGMSVAGSVGNVFMISAIMIEDHLKKRGNSFLVNIALADILITGIVIPASTVVILADVSELLVVCHVQWFLALVSCLVCLLTISAVALENYARLFLPPDCYDCLTPCKITCIIFFIWIAAVTVVSLQTAFDLGPDYCSHMARPVVLTSTFHITVGTLFVFVPALITCSCYSIIACRVRLFYSNPSFNPSVTFTIDYDLMKTNICSFICFVIFWLPFGIILAAFSCQTVSLKLFYDLAWFALSKSCVHNLLYCVTNRYFRNAYVNLFHYCCCKTTVSFSRRQREPVRPSGDVRVLIIPGYDMYSYTNPARSRDTNSTKSSCKRVTNRPNVREVYEL